MTNFRNFAVCVMILTLVSSGKLFSQSASLFGGLNFAKLSGDAPENTKYNGGTGYIAGVQFDYPVFKDVKLSIQPNYSLYKTIIGFDVGEEDYKDSLDLTSTYFRLPLVATFEALNGYTYFSSGIDIGFFNEANLKTMDGGDETDISDYFEQIDVAVLFGAGVRLPVSSFHFNAEIRYAQSLINASSGKTLEEVSYFLPRFRMSGFQILGSFSYKF
jgi:hypothetical protein